MPLLKLNHCVHACNLLFYCGPRSEHCFAVFPHRLKFSGRSCAGARGPPPKSLDWDENFKPEHALFCRELRFVAIYALFGDLWAKKVPFWVKNSVSWKRKALKSSEKLKANNCFVKFLIQGLERKRLFATSTGV